MEQLFLFFFGLFTYGERKAIKCTRRALSAAREECSPKSHDPLWRRWNPGPVHRGYRRDYPCVRFASWLLLLLGKACFRVAPNFLA